MISPPPVPSPGSIGARVWNLVTDVHVRVYRRSGGRVGGRWFGADVLLLHHVGRKSGGKRTTPLLYVRDGESFVIVASRGGSTATPAWYYNLQSRPEAVIEVGSDRRRVRARTAAGEERERLWKRAVAAYGDYETYQRRTDRQIPVIVLEPAEG